MDQRKRRVVDSVSAREMKRSVLKMVRLINAEERYFFVKAMDVFYEMPANHQHGFLSYLANEVDMKIWLDKVEDSTQYPDVIRSILFYYSGRGDLGQPSKSDFKSKLAEYLKSAEFGTSEDGADIGDFSTALEEL